MKLIDSDEEEEVQAAGDSAVTEREAIANELFEGGDDAGEVLNVEHVCSTSEKHEHTNVERVLHFEGKQIRCEIHSQDTLAGFLYHLICDNSHQNQNKVFMLCGFCSNNYRSRRIDV